MRYNVEKMNWHHVGRQRVCLHETERDGADRFDVVQISLDGRSVKAVVIGLAEDKEGKMYLDFDDRKALGIKPGKSYEFRVTKLGNIAKYWWYFTARDPAVHLPARLAALSIILGILSLVLALKPFVCP